MIPTKNPVVPAVFRRAAPVLLAAVLTLSPLAAYAASISEAVGSVQIRKAGSQSWGSVTGAGHVLGPGDEIKTGRGSRTVLQFDDGSKVEIGPNGSFQLEEARPDSAAMKFNLGFMKAWVSKALARRFQVRTPTAVCSVRGTEFGVNVADGGNTAVNVFSGLVGVGDMKGNEVLLAEGQSVSVTADGILQKSQAPSEQGSDRVRQALKREVGLDMTKEEVQAAAALEIKQAVYQEGKAIIDVNGNRVRIEEYIIRPTPNSFKLVALNERSDRFDYFYYSAVLNKNLPDDMALALRQLQGQPLVKPDYFQRSYEIGRSNTQDNILEKTTGGHLVDVNNNTDATDDVTLAFDPRIDGIVRLTVGAPGANNPAQNQSYWETLYDTYDFKFNGNPHTSWTNRVAAYNPLTDTGGVQSYDEATQINRNDFGYSIVAGAQCLNADNCTGNPQPGVDTSVTYREAAGGKWERRQTFIIDDEGKLASTSQIPLGQSRKTELLLWNFQEVFTASEFGGRKIDLVITPRVLIESGLIP